MKGINIVVTYNCNMMCSSCQYSCGPHKKGIMEAGVFGELVMMGYNEGYRDYIMIDGGEPFLHAGILSKYLKKIRGLDTRIYIVTNGFWGPMDVYMDILGDLRDMGLSGVIFEFDYFHSFFIDIETVKQAIFKCMAQRLEVYFRAGFVSGNIGACEDQVTFRYVKEIRKDFKNVGFIFNEIGSDNRIFGRNHLKDEKTILYNK